MSSDPIESVLADARRLFDVAGINSTEEGNWLILGLETSDERDLDEFTRQEDGNINFLAGFDKHIRPRLEKLIEIAGERGINAEIFGNCGYPRGQELKIKQSAVTAGLVQWGRNSMVMHPEHGLNLRFSVIKLQSTRLVATQPGEISYKLSPQCTSCKACQESCPVSIISEGRVTDAQACLASLHNMTGDKRLSWCRVCIDVCPAGQSSVNT
ncbi:hypothetical protein ACFLUL_00180 [Chloroflexota bacterium]